MANEKLLTLADTISRKNCTNVQVSRYTKALVECLATLDDVSAAISYITDDASENLKCEYGDSIIDFQLSLGEVNDELQKIIAITLRSVANSTGFKEM